MSKRLPQNTNLRLYTQSIYRGLPVMTTYGPLIENYLERIYDTIHSALREHPRVTAIRCDLHFPSQYGEPDSKVISRFIDSLKAQIVADQKRADRSDRRKHYSRVRYVWVREIKDADAWHYHVLILFNQDAYKWLGKFDKTVGNMAARIQRAWASALGWPLECCGGLVHFGDNPRYHLNTNHYPHIMGLPELFHRVSYFAKVETKHYGDFTKHFGSSRD